MGKYDALFQPMKVGNVEVKNRFAMMPMGIHSARLVNPDGSFSDDGIRYYERIAQGGVGLIITSAITVQGRFDNSKGSHSSLDHAGPEYIEQSKKLTERIHKAGAKIFLQLSGGSGRTLPMQVAEGEPIAASDDMPNVWDPRVKHRGLTREEIQFYIDSFGHGAKLAKEAGFDGVDIKTCHRYLLSELLAAHTRKGKYGGAFENRSRFLFSVIKKVREAVGKDFIIASRFNVFDAHPYPYGFGVSKDAEWIPDLTEPLLLVGKMAEAGVDLLSNSAGNPYYRFPQVTRPFDQPAVNGEIPEEHPLESVARLLEFTKKIQETVGSVPVVGNGYSWLREYLPFVGAANKLRGGCMFVGLGRQAFAYPDAPRDIMDNGRMEKGKCCIACSKCTQIMRDHGMTGCVVRDSEIYVPMYQKGRKGTGFAS